jgi:hypothetical protein
MKEKLLFWFKPRKIHVDFFTARKDAFLYAPIDNAGKYLPEWWKDLPKDCGAGSTATNNMRHCAGFIDLYRISLVLPMWSDVEIDVKGDGTLTYLHSDRLSSIEFHSSEQRGRLMANHISAKLMSPWVAECKEDISWTCVPALYNQQDIKDYTVCPGVLNFKYQNSTNVNLFIPNRPNKFIIPHRQPLMHFVPLSDRRVKIHRHLVTTDEFRQREYAMAGIKFSRKYDAVKKIIKENKL